MKYFFSVSVEKKLRNNAVFPTNVVNQKLFLWQISINMLPIVYIYKKNSCTLLNIVDGAFKNKFCAVSRGMI